MNFELVLIWNNLITSIYFKRIFTFYRSIFQDMVSMDVLVMKIMNFAQRLVDADRASLFLVDGKNKELYATIFDIGVEETGASDGLYSISHDSEEIKVRPSKEIRFPLGTGIAGQVAMTGDVLNIRDAYGDSRFNRTVDQLTGALSTLDSYFQIKCSTYKGWLTKI